MNKALNEGAASASAAVIKLEKRKMFEWRMNENKLRMQPFNSFSLIHQTSFIKLINYFISGGIQSLTPALIPNLFDAENKFPPPSSLFSLGLQ